MDKKLCDYVEAAMTQEHALLTYRCIINLLDEKIQSMGKPQYFCPPVEEKRQSSFKTDFTETLYTFYFILVLTLGIGFIVMAIMRNKEKKEYKRQYLHQMSLYQEAIENDKKRVEQELIRKSQLIEEKRIMVERYNDAQEKLLSFYECDIIFPKYREFIPIATICEYFKSGRCSSLHGSDGAYNLYESEKRQDLIITHLEVIEQNLSDIKNNQYMIYTAMCETNNILSGVGSRLNAIGQNVEISAYNTKVMKNELQMQTLMQLHSTSTL